jgi:hypothetical protein
LEYNGFNLEKLSLKDDSKQNERMTYINSAMDKLKNLDKIYSNSYNIIRDNILNFMTAKNNCISDITEHYDKLINALELQKSASIFMIEKFSKDKLGNYNDAIQSIDKYREMVYIQMQKLEGVKNQKIVSNIPLADEINMIQNLGLEAVENKEFLKNIENMIKEMQSDIIPKIVIKNECKFFIDFIFS